MIRGARILKEKTLSQNESDAELVQQQLKTIWDISGSDLTKLSLENDAQPAKIKALKDKLLLASQISEAAKRKYSALFENNPCGLFILSEKGVIIELNSAGAMILGMKKPQLINQYFKFFISEESIVDFNNCFNSLFKTQGSSKLDVKLRKVDGSPVYVHIDAAINEDKVTCYLSASIIAEPKHTDESFQIAEEKYQKLHESLMDGFAYVDMEGRITESNEIYHSMLGYTAEELEKLSYQDITPEYWHPIEAKIIDEQVLVSGFSEVYEKEYRKKDGAIFPVELRTILMRDEKGANAGMWAIVRDITQRKKAENILKANEEKYRTLIDFAPDAFFQGDEDGNLIVVNSRAIELTGYSRADLLSMNISDLIPDFIKKENPLRYDLLKKGSVIKVERAILRKSGELVHIEMNSKAMPDGTYQCFARDITCRKHAEEVLRESEERYRELADSITDDFFSLDTDLKFTYCNKSFADNVGIKSTDIIGKPIYAIFTDIKGTLREMVYLDVLKTKQPGSCIDEFLVNGEKRYFEIKTYPSKKGIVVFIYDINNRIQTEKELTLFKSIIESSEASVAVGDTEGKLLYINPAYEKLFGRSFDELIFINFSDFFTPDALVIIENEMMPTLIRGNSWEGEIEAFKKNGQRIPVRINAGSIKDAEGKNAALFFIMDDISEQKNAEKDKLHLELLKGEESERLRIAHDLHNHIGHIIIAIKIHIERAIASATDDKDKVQLERLLEKVIFALKEVRLVSSKLAERFATPWKLRQQISTFLTDLEITSNLQIVQKIDPLPDEIPDMLMRTMVGILEEALSNVMKHSDATLVYIHIFIKKDRLFINLRDNGKGMDNSAVHRGSGLNFLNEEAEQIGGEISIKSVPGKFCMLKFNAPINPVTS